MTIRALDLQRWYDDHGSALVEHGLRVLLILLIALVARSALHRSINRLIRTAITGGPLQPLKERAKGTRFDASPLLSERRRQRTETLGSVLRSIGSFAVAAVAGSMVLSEFGLDLTPILASAGIIGVAVGFGAQNLVKDFLTGMAMLLEDQYGVGDVIDAGVASGTVEAVSLRTTRLRDDEGTVWHIRNGEIIRIGNKGQGWANALLDLPLPPNADVSAVRALVRKVTAGLAADPDFANLLLDDAPQVGGLESITREGLVLRVTLRTAPLQQWTVERELRERLAHALAERGLPLRAPITHEGA